jgi:mannosylglycerate hydrolase
MSDRQPRAGTGRPDLTVHLISHNHWDREWIFTARYANRWLPTFFDNLFRRLEEQPEYRFVLDGQTLIIEDYLNQLSPDEAAARESQIRKYARRGQLLVGPAYLQPDWSLVSGESLVRNLLIGRRMAGRFGPVMAAGWLLDNFGQIAQAPQILRGFDIDGVFVWRGVEMPPEKLRTEFWWESPDGSRVLGIYLLDSYRNAMVLAMTREIAVERIRSHTEILRRFAATPNVLLMNGYEQVPEPDDVLPIIAQANVELGPELHVVQSTPPDYLAAVRAAIGPAGTDELPVLRGYLYSGRYAPILKGVYSSRSFLNQQNSECQRELERWAEKFNTFAWAFGFDYPEDRFEQAWKTLLLNHTHDDLCGCCIDPIARDMEERFAEVSRMAQVMSSESLRAICQTIDTTQAENGAVVVFNPSARPRREMTSLSLEIPEEMAEFYIHDSHGRVIPYQLISRIGDKADLYLWTPEVVPSVGYRTYYLAEGPAPEGGVGDRESAKRVVTSADERTMENEYLWVRINDDGSLDIREKIHDSIYRNLAYFEDGGDAGDTYDFSPPARDQVITSLAGKGELNGDRQVRVTLETAGPLVARFRIELVLKVPGKLAADRQSRSARRRKLPIVSYVELAANAGHVEIMTVVNNVVKDHRLRVLFPSGLATDRAFAGMPYDVATFPTQDGAGDLAPDRSGEPAGADGRQPLQGLMLAGRYTEPVHTHPFQGFVCLAGEADHGPASLTVFSRGLSEFEILPGDEDGRPVNSIALTLLRGVGWLARSDLLTREGDVGPHIFTPEAQCLGLQRFDYAIYPHGREWQEANLHFEADRHNLKFRAVQTDAHPGRLPDEFSFLSWVGERPEGALKLTAVKLAETEDSVIVRFFNVLDEPASGFLRLGGQVTEAWWANMAEASLSRIRVDNGTIPVEARGKEIVTLKLWLKPWKLIEDFRRHHVRIIQPVAIDQVSEGTIGGIASFSRTGRPRLLTKKEVRAEQARAKQLAEALQAVRSEAYILNEEIERQSRPELAQQALLQRLKGREATLARQHYEARISALLNQQLLITAQMESELDGIGESLNWARVRKRVGEFLIHYYEAQQRGKGA